MPQEDLPPPISGTIVPTYQPETGYDAWLRYAPIEGARTDHLRDALPAVVSILGASILLQSAQQEIVRGIRGMLGRILRAHNGAPAEAAIVLGRVGDIGKAFPQAALPAVIEPEGYWLKWIEANGQKHLLVAGESERGVLYGAFALLRMIASGELIDTLDHGENPYAPIRWVNQWDNLDGTIERGYGGGSIFWENGHVRNDLSRVIDYGRLLASLGINGCSINNVNVDPRILAPDYLPQIARIAEAFRPWGVRIILSVDLGAPKAVGGLDTFDPLDKKVSKWWQTTADELYAAVPDLAGFVLKADSEGRVGPSAYGRTHADAANVLARAVQPHGGLVCYRGFVYDHHMDWRNLKNDRARASYDNFHPLDGQFEDNVAIQIKNGPIDFQVREPVSPIFGGLTKTNMLLEVQVTQEYFGQARHTVFLVPQWKEVLDFDLCANGRGTPVKDLVAGKTFERPAGGFVAVTCAGLDENWLGNHLSQANLYGFGRLAWNPNLTSEQIIDEWTRQTLGSDPEVLKTVAEIQLSSWRAYENYTGPLGLQTLTDIVGDHYGPAVEASERNGWGQWHRADAQGVGMDRTVATGTGFIGQYQPSVARIYESLEACPDDLLLFFHHVPYTYKLHCGKSVIQYIYDSHYEGAEAVEGYVQAWRALKGRVDDLRYQDILAQLEYQAAHARVWRDAIAGWFLRTSGISDTHGRVGHNANRVEAESMQLEGYSVIDVNPWETASGGKAIACAGKQGAASFPFAGDPGWYTLRVQYFDQNNGASRFEIWIGDQLIDEWVADDRLPSSKINGSTSKSRIVRAVALRPGDEIRIVGAPDGGEAASIDYVEIELA